MSDKLPSRPTLDIREALNELLRRNERTRGAEVGEMYLGPDLFMVRLRRVRVVDSTCETVDRTADPFDLMDEHARGL